MTRNLSFVAVAVAVVGLSVATSSDAQPKKKTPPALITGTSFASYHAASRARIDKLSDNGILVQKAEDAYAAELATAVGYQVSWTTQCTGVSKDGSVGFEYEWVGGKGLVKMHFADLVDKSTLMPEKLRSGQLLVLRGTIVSVSQNPDRPLTLSVTVKNPTLSIK
jgi:hypothetical protein